VTEEEVVGLKTDAEGRNCPDICCSWSKVAVIKSQIPKEPVQGVRCEPLKQDESEHTYIICVLDDSTCLNCVGFVL
jgi:hypothetical protein